MSLNSHQTGLGYQSTSSRDPIWTRVSDEPSENSPSRLGSKESVQMETSVSSLGSEKKHGKGLNVASAAFFVAGEMAGSGILALPKAVVDCGWIGLVLVIVFCINAAFGGTRLAHCWAILEERYPEYRTTSRNPYSTIAYRAVGKWGSILVSGCIQITLFGAAVVYLLLAAQIVQDLLREVIPGFGYCWWFLFFALLMIPPMWLGTPKDFGFAGIGALLTTAISCVLILAQIIMDGMCKGQLAPHGSHSPMEFFLSFGVILFAYGGASTFPTIQNDMNDREKFSKSVVIGFAVIILLYIPVTFGGYYVYGDHIDANILLSLRRGIFVSTANIFMAVHLLLAFFIIINPVCQELEEIFNVPHEFCIKRCVIRTIMVLLMIVVGETIPKFGMILALVGGSTITLTTFVLPNFFYMRLCDQKSAEWPERFIPPHVRVYMWELILVGLLGGTAATYNAVIAIVGPNSLTKPCYWPN